MAKTNKQNSLDDLEVGKISLGEKKITISRKPPWPQGGAKVGL